MRRKEKEVSDKRKIEEAIRQADYGTLGLVNGRKPYSVPLNFGYSGKTFYFHSAVKGRKVDVIRKNRRGCISLVINAAVVQAPVACDWGTAFVSVFAEGTIREIKGLKEKTKALQIIMAQYSKKKWSFPEKMVDRIRVYAMKATTLTCKKSGE